MKNLGNQRGGWGISPLLIFKSPPVPSPEVRRAQIQETPDLMSMPLPSSPLPFLPLFPLPKAPLRQRSAPRKGCPPPSPRKWGWGRGWLAHLPIPDVGGQDLILLILWKERELSKGGPVGWEPTWHTSAPTGAAALCPCSPEDAEMGWGKGPARKKSVFY